MTTSAEKLSDDDVNDFAQSEEDRDDHAADREHDAGETRGLLRRWPIDLVGFSLDFVQKTLETAARFRDRNGALLRRIRT